MKTVELRLVISLIALMLVCSSIGWSDTSAYATSDTCKWIKSNKLQCGGSRTNNGANSNPPKNGNNSRSDSGKRSGNGKNGSSGKGNGDYCPQSLPGAICGRIDLPATSGPADAPPPPPPPSPTFMETQFKKYSIPPSVINSLPGDSWGIAHRKTAFWADSSIQYINDTILGYPITVKAIPRKYHWNFGDGNTLHTQHPGNKPTDINKARIYNVYTAPGNVTVKLATTYSGMYKIGDSPWITIPGTTDIQSSNADLRIYRFHKYLVNRSCKEDPTGPDCTP